MRSNEVEAARQSCYLRGMGTHSVDGVDRIREYWAKERPEWDTSSIDVWDRILLLARHYDEVMVKAISDYDVTIGGLDVLATLRRSGPSFALTPTTLKNDLLLSSGTMTHRLDQLEKRGLIKRKADPSDRRGRIIHLTAKGLELIEKALLAQYEEGRRLLRSLERGTEETLVKALRTLQDSLDEEDTRLARQRSEGRQS